MTRTTVFLTAALCLALVAVLTGTRTMQPVRPGPTTPSADTGSLTLTARLSHPAIAQGSQRVYVTALVHAPQVPGQRRAPVNLALVIDRSGSMSGFKLEQAKRAARELIGQLGPEDRLSLVHYGSEVTTLPSLLATPENKATLARFVDAIEDGGGTNTSEALTAARQQLLVNRGGGAVDRLVLISDGQPTEGLTDTAALEVLARGARRDGVTVSALGVGDDFNETLMEGLASVGGGAYGFIQDASQLGPIFQRELASAGQLVARHVTLELRAPEGSRVVGLVGDAPHSVRDGVLIIDLPDFAAGQDERVVVELETQGQTPGETVAVAGLTLRSEDLLQQQPGLARAQLATRVVATTEEAQAAEDPEAILFAARAQAAHNTQAAAEALKEGRRDEAVSLLSANRGTFMAAEKIAGSAAVQGDVDALDGMLQQLPAASDSAQVNTFAKTARRKARVDFGLQSSTY
jgi:Ca-activated chloride channel family protein